VRMLDMQVTLHDRRIAMQVTLHYEAIVMQVTLHDKRIVMQVTLHYEAIVMQVTLHDKRIVIQVTLHYEAMKPSKQFQLAYDVRMSSMIPQLVIILEGEMCTSGNIVTNSRMMPSWREIVSLTFSEAGVLHMNWTSLEHCVSRRVKMSRDVLTIGSTMRISLLYRGEYSQWVERFMNYLEEQTDGEAAINSIKNGDQPLPRVTQVSIVGTTSTEQSPLKDKSMWSNQEKRIQKIDRLARSLLIQGLLNDIYSLIDSNKTAKDLRDALARHMLGSEYGEQDRKAAVLYEFETFKSTEGELFLDTYIRYLQVINNLKKCGYSKDNYVNDAMVSKKKNVMVTSDPLALIAEKTMLAEVNRKLLYLWTLKEVKPMIS
nr:hypothetical protein [Tanacetum cinerariifolium]